jgi:hypothetical protein
MGYETEAELRYEVGLGSRALSARRPGTSELLRMLLPRTLMNKPLDGFVPKFNPAHKLQTLHQNYDELLEPLQKARARDRAEAARPRPSAIA